MGKKVVVKKKKKRRETFKKKKLVDLISVNLGIKGSTKTMKQMMLEAGYSKASADQQSTLLVGIKDDLNPIVKKMMDAREQAFKQLKSKITKAKYRDCVDGIDKMTKNIQLLSGGETSREEQILSWRK